MGTPPGRARLPGEIFGHPGSILSVSSNFLSRVQKGSTGDATDFLLGVRGAPPRM